MTQHAEPHHDPRFDDPRAEADEDWTPPELPAEAPNDQQPDPERADWMPPEHRPPSILGDTPDERGARQDPAAMPGATDPPVMPSPATDPARRAVGMPDTSLRHDHDLTPPPGLATDPAPGAPPPPPAPERAMGTAPGGTTAAGPAGTTAAAPDGAMGAPAGAAPSTPVTATGTIDPLWPDAEVARFEGRWREVQLGFVDDPRHAADQARTLLDEVVDRLSQAISDRRSELDTWRTDGNGAGNGSDDTEAMLSAVRRYRRLMDQLLAVGHPH